MTKITKSLFLLPFFAFALEGCTHRASSLNDFQPYLENTRELQIPQWEDTNWYLQDWTSQKSGAELVRGFYESDIIRDQKIGHAKMPVLEVGPNFYRLSGLDKRRVMTTIDEVYGITASKPDRSFFLEDWYTHKKIGVFDRNGLRLD